MRLGEPVGGGNKLFGLVAVDRLDQGVAGGEMAIERPGADTRGPRDLVEAGRRSLFRESGLRRFKQADAVTLRIGSRLADSSGFSLIGHAENTLAKRRQSPYLKRRHSPLTPKAIGRQWFAGAGSGAPIDEGDDHGQTFRRDVHHR